MIHRRKLYLYFHGIGDSLLFNTILFHLGRASGEKFLVASPHPEVYRGNPYVTHLPTNNHTLTVIIRRFLSFFGLIKSYEYIDYYQEGMPPKHILDLLSERVGLRERVKHPLIFLTDVEKSIFFLPLSEKPWIAIQSTGNKVTTENKNWSVEKFQAVADVLKKTYSIVQFGSPGDPALNVDLNLCGEIDLRELFAALGECDCFVGQVGFLMHAAASRSVPSVIVYGGFEAPWQSGYEDNINIYNPVPCAPCWLWGPCPHNKKCMNEISADTVVDSVKSLIERHQQKIL